MSGSRDDGNSFISNENNDYDDYDDVQKDPALPSTLLTFFKNATAADKKKNTYSNDGLRRECEQSSHALSVSIIDLLDADNQFLSATNPIFRAQHAKIDDSVMLSHLNSLAAAIKKIIDANKQAQINAEPMTELHHKTLDAAITYIIESTKERLDELHAAHDKYFTLYQSNKNNKLKPLIEELSNVSLKSNV